MISIVRVDRVDDYQGFLACRKDDKNVISVMAKSRMPVDRWVATIMGCRLVLTTKNPRIICTDMIMPAIIAGFLAGADFLKE